MKILHTADWHLGKKLYTQELLGDCRLFLDWLIAEIKTRRVDALLIAGDVFDSANPPQEALQAYYHFLRDLIPTGCQLIITGGNHDSAAVLNGPKDIFKRLNVHVIGGACDDCLEEIIPLRDASGAVAAVVCAVPFLRDRDLKRSIEGETQTDRRAAVREGIRRRYQQAYEHCREVHPEVPHLGMGHLFVTGSALSDDDDRLHAIGTLDLFEAALFPPFDYLALGHIHRPQRIGQQAHVRYAGSPIPLSFSEHADGKMVIELVIEAKKLTEINEISTPNFRSLKRVKGRLETVEIWLNDHRHDNSLITLVEVELQEPTRTPMLLDVAKLFFEGFQSDHATVLSWRFRFDNQAQTIEQLFGEGSRLQELRERDVFDKWLDDKDIEGEDRLVLAEAFDELLTEIHSA
ncbi:MAG: exonuclease subunit SbcD [Cytophagaceae bacterium]|nr:exonuclease subunit SbcD [Cytophagaceae bacterium]